METLKLKEIVDLYEEIKKDKGQQVADNMPIILGDDEELNGTHQAYYAEKVKPKDPDYYGIYGLEDIKEEIILIS